MKNTPHGCTPADTNKQTQKQEPTSRDTQIQTHKDIFTAHVSLTYKYIVHNTICTHTHYTHKYTYTAHTQLHITHRVGEQRGNYPAHPKASRGSGGLDEVGQCVNTTTQISRFHCSNEVFVVKRNI